MFAKNIIDETNILYA